MVRSVPCPVCQSDVPAPREAEPGIALTCPACREVFTPPHLVKKAHDPKIEESFDLVRRKKSDATKSAEAREKRRKAKLYRKAGREYERDVNRTNRPSLFGGPELALLMFGLVAGLAAIIGYTAARRFPSIGEGALIVIVYCTILGVFALRRLMHR